MRQPKEVIKHWIDSVCNEGRGLTAWETDFMMSISDQFDDSGSLSQKQEEILERIYTKRV